MKNMVIGHETQRSHLARAVATGQAAHTYLFGGIRGLGKATVAREFLSHLLCRKLGESACLSCDACQATQSGIHPDFFTLAPDGIGHLDIGEVRGLRTKLFSSAFVGEKKVALIDDADTMTTQAVSTLLKILEEPSRGTHIVLVTSKPGHILPTVRSRARYLGFAPVLRSKLDQYLKETRPDQNRTQFERYLNIADGRPGVLMNLLAEGEEGEKWEEVSKDVQTLLGASQMQRLRQIENFAPSYLSRGGALFFLAHLRDDVRSKVRQGSRAWADALAPVIEAEHSIVYNTSPRLALEWLALHLP